MENSNETLTLTIHNNENDNIESSQLTVRLN